MANGSIYTRRWITPSGLKLSSTQPIELSRTPASVTKAAPDAGEHNAEILLELGFDADEVQHLKEENIL
jgi:crotonobetainyl-CoA:carnitine CoA-transferase CaiB-like acyl-CoA transferase